MKVGIIGTNRGRTHCGTFRHWGHHIEMIAGRDPEKSRDVARRENVPFPTTRPEDLVAMDVVVIASPARTHLHFIEMFPNKALLCEKPLCGSPVDPEMIDRLRDSQVYVNYAFPFLKTMQTAKHIIGSGGLGAVFRIVANISVYFDIKRSPEAWFLDVAVHPLSFFNFVFGVFELVQYHSEGGRLNISTVLTNGDQVLNLNLYRAHTPSLKMDITFVGDRGEMKIQGG